MAIAATNSYNGKGIAESFEDVIFDISPEDTPLLSAAKRTTAAQTYHQWQTDALAAAATNAQLEGLDSTYATLAATTVLGNYTQISAKTNQNINRTHPLRIEGMNMEDKIARVEARRLKKESAVESRKNLD